MIGFGGFDLREFDCGKCEQVLEHGPRTITKLHVVKEWQKGELKRHLSSCSHFSPVTQQMSEI